jgi:hypothetical protein
MLVGRALSPETKYAVRIECYFDGPVDHDASSSGST